MKIWLPKFNVYSKRLSIWQEKFWNKTSPTFMGIRDNIAGRKAFEFMVFGRSGIQQSNSKLFSMQPQGATKHLTAVSVFPYGTTAAAGIVETGLVTQIDRAAREYDTTGGTEMFPCDTWGWAADANNWFGVAAFGSIDDDTYTDGGGFTRTVRSMHDADNCAPGGGDLYFSIDTASVPNTDATFVDITWDNISGTPITITRSTEMTYTASLNSDTHWRDLTPTSDWTDADANTDFVITTS